MIVANQIGRKIMATKKKKGQNEVIEADAIEVTMENVEAEDGNVEVIGREQENSLVMYLDPDADKKTFVNFIRKTERFVRGSPEYKDYVTFLRNEEGLDACAFLKNIDVDKAEIQLHHAISDLYTLCVTVCNRMMSEGMKVSTFILADEVLKLHFDGKIALVPLSTTMHEMVHAGVINVPSNAVYGDWEAYYEEHEPFMDDYERQRYADAREKVCLTRDDVLRIEYVEKIERKKNVRS